MKPTSAGEALTLGTQRLASLPTARRDAELLLLHTLGRDRAWLLAHPEAEITSTQLAQFERLLARRARHEPIQYITGQQEFFGLTLRVTPGVLIPRPETEHLVETALARIPPDRIPDQPTRILDVGTGSGAIAIAIAAHRPHAAVTAVDLSPAALAIARENAAAHHVAIRFIESDLLAALPNENFDLILSNPPYVPASDELEPQVRDFEPHSALFAGESGLDIYRRLIPQAHHALVSGGWLLMEIGHGRQPALSGLLTGWQNLSFIPDLQGIPRVVIAQKPQLAGPCPPAGKMAGSLNSE
ncbi:MAG: peptide chain release factor N(5)-glutamine methyltransferase [Acidobacteriaceae bacterium]